MKEEPFDPNNFDLSKLGKDPGGPFMNAYRALRQGKAYTPPAPPPAPEPDGTRPFLDALRAARSGEQPAPSPALPKETQATLESLIESEVSARLASEKYESVRVQQRKEIDAMFAKKPTPAARERLSTALEKAEALFNSTGADPANFIDDAKSFRDILTEPDAEERKRNLNYIFDLIEPFDRVDFVEACRNFDKARQEMLDTPATSETPTAEPPPEQRPFTEAYLRATGG